MIRYLLLALLGRSAAYGYELKAAFERLLAGTWPINIGQVYRELARMEANGLVECTVVAQDLLPDRKVYELTERGSKELERWLEAPPTSLVRLRDEVFLKVIVQLGNHGAALETIWRQREAHLTAIAELGRLRNETDAATGLLIDGLVLRLEADLRWLDLAEDADRAT